MIEGFRWRRETAQKKAARLAGVDRPYFGAIERGEFNISFGTLVKIAAGLGTTACAYASEPSMTLGPAQASEGATRTAAANTALAIPALASFRFCSRRVRGRSPDWDRKRTAEWPGSSGFLNLRLFIGE
jgi:transcriptional regulator with XRE-family HTH domain